MNQREIFLLSQIPVFQQKVISAANKLKQDVQLKELFLKLEQGFELREISPECTFYLRRGKSFFTTKDPKDFCWIQKDGTVDPGSKVIL